MVEESAGMDTETRHRVSAAWENCKKCSGVLCDREMHDNLNGKTY